MLVHQEYCRHRIIGQFKRSFIDVLKVKKEIVDDEIEIIQSLNFKEVK